MERLTERDEFGNADIIGVDGMDLQCNLGFDEFNKVTNTLNRLAEYEDLEEQGKLPKLPCAVGDTVYRINKGAKRPVIPLQVINFKIFGNLSDNFKMECADEWGGGYTYRKMDIGKGIFLTQEEAEAALEELQRRT